MSIELETILKLFLAVLFGGAIGYEREIAHKTAGLRTNILVCLGATLIMLLETFYHTKYPNTSDHLRIAAQVVTGIGFLGAGTIIQTRSHVKGLTTAATIWVTAIIGMTVGEGFYFAAIIAVIFTLASLRLLKRLEHYLAIKGGRVLIVVGESQGNSAEKITQALSEIKVPIWDMRLSINREHIIEATIHIPADADVDLVINEIMKIDGIHRATTELLLE